MWDLNNLEESRKFYFEENKIEWVELRVCSFAKTNELRKAAGITQKVEYLKVKEIKNGKGKERQERSTYLDDDENKMEILNDAVNDYVIVDWNLIDPNSQPIPCTKENKKLLMGNSNKFASFVAKNLETMRKDIDGEEDEELKN